MMISGLKLEPQVYITAYNRGALLLEELSIKFSVYGNYTRASITNGIEARRRQMV